MCICIHTYIPYVHIYTYMYVCICVCPCIIRVDVSYGMCMDAYMHSDIHMYTYVHGLCFFQDPHMNFREEGSRSLLGTEINKLRSEGTTFHTKNMMRAQTYLS